jgi:hypothetical protein
MCITFLEFITCATATGFGLSCSFLTFSAGHVLIIDSIPYFPALGSKPSLPMIQKGNSACEPCTENLTFTTMCITFLERVHHMRHSHRVWLELQFLNLFFRTCTDYRQHPLFRPSRPKPGFISKQTDITFIRIETYSIRVF